jgi:hypothetical protein
MLKIEEIIKTFPEIKKYFENYSQKEFGEYLEIFINNHWTFAENPDCSGCHENTLSFWTLTPPIGKKNNLPLFDSYWCREDYWKKDFKNYLFTQKQGFTLFQVIRENNDLGIYNFIFI